MSRFAALALALAVALAGCPGPKEDAPVPAAPDAARTTVVAAKPQAIADGADVVTITVTVRDASGNPLGGHDVTLAATGDSLVLTQPGVKTAATGVAVGAVVSTRSGAKTVSAIIDPSGSAVAVTATADIEFVAGAARRATFASQPLDATAGELLASIAVRIEDALGNVVPDPGFAVTLALASADPLVGTASATPIAGVATFSDLAVVRAGSHRLVATAGALPAASSDPFEVVPAAAAALAFASLPLPTTAGTTLAPAVDVAVLDRWGNVGASAAIVTLTLASGDPLFGTTTVDAASGVARFEDLSVRRAGTQRLVAAAPGLDGVTSGDFDVAPAGASRLVFSTQPGSITAGSLFSPAPAVRVEDAYGNLALAADPVVVSAGGATVSGGTSVPAASGTARFEGLSVTTAGTGRRLVATCGALEQATSDAFDVSPGPAAALRFDLDLTGEVRVHEPIAGPPRVTVVDTHGNVVAEPGRVVSVRVSGGTAALRGTTSLGAASGSATFSGVALDRAGTFRLVATSAGLPSAESAPFDARAVWTSAGLPGGEIGALTYDPNDPARVFASSYTGGVFRSGDGGASWSRAIVAEEPTFGVAPAVAVKPGDSSILYVSVANGVRRSTDGGVTFPDFFGGLPEYATALRFAQGAMFAATSDGVFRSDDDGSNWARAGTGTSGWTSTLLVDPVNPATMYVGTGSGLSKTTDGGATWAPSSVGLTGGVSVIAADPGNPAHLHAISGNALFLSLDGGVTWGPGGSSPPYGSVMTLAIDAAATGRSVYAGTYGSGIVRAAVGTTTWSSASASVTDLRDRVVQSLAAHPSDPLVIQAGTRGGVLRTTDGGTTWTPSRTGIDAHGVPSLAKVASAPTTLYAVTYAGLARTTDDGATWAMMGLGASGLGVLLDPADPRYVYSWGSPYGISRSPDGGATGTYCAGVGGDVFSATITANGTVYVGTGTQVLKSTDHGATFAAASSGLPAGKISALARSGAGTLLAGAAGTVFSSIDGGAIWTATSANLGIGREAQTIVASGSRAYLTTTTRELFRSLDGGVTWSRGVSPAAVGAALSGLAIDPSDADVVYLATSRGLFKSVDAGASWRATASGLYTTSTMAVLVDPLSPSIVWAGTAAGVYRSTTAGE